MQLSGGMKSIMRYQPRLLLDTEWEVKLHRGRQRKTWRKVISELLLLLNLDSQEIYYRYAYAE